MLPPLIIEPEDLRTLMTERDDLLIVDLCNIAHYKERHIQGAVHVHPSELVSGIKPAVGKLPEVEQLRRLFSRIGYTKDKYIIAYDDEGGGWAGRFLWTLDVIGHTRMSYLNGGSHAWLAQQLDMTPSIEAIIPTEVSLEPSDEFTASKQAVLDSLDDPNTVIWDARSPEEHIGTKAFSTRAGRIPGAINLEWTEAMDHQQQVRIRTDIAEVLNAIGISADKKIITHCQSHHRSGFTYLVGKSLGYDIRAYDGAWSEWGNDPNTPIEVG